MRYCITLGTLYQKGFSGDINAICRHWPVTSFDTGLVVSDGPRKGITGQGSVRRRWWLRDSAALPPAEMQRGVAMQEIRQR